MKNIKRKVISIILAISMIACMSATAMAVEEAPVSTTQTTLASSTELIPQIMGTLSGTPTSGSFTLNKKYNEVKLLFSNNGSDKSAVYKIVIRGPRNVTISLIADGTVRSYYIGQMNKGTYTYTISREHGTGTHFFIMQLHDFTIS